MAHYSPNGYKLNAQAKRNQALGKSKPVKLCDDKGAVLQIYESAKVLSQTLGIPNTAILDRCNGKIKNKKIYKGYMFKFV